MLTEEFFEGNSQAKFDQCLNILNMINIRLSNTSENTDFEQLNNECMEETIKNLLRNGPGGTTRNFNDILRLMGKSRWTDFNERYKVNL